MPLISFPKSTLKSCEFFFRFHLLTATGTYTRIQLGWEILSSSGTTEIDPAYVARIDGNVAKLSPFKNLTIPPPLSAFDLKTPDAVKQVG